jgi:hypothetical protein
LPDDLKKAAAAIVVPLVPPSIPPAIEIPLPRYHENASEVDRYTAALNIALAEHFSAVSQGGILHLALRAYSENPSTETAERRTKALEKVRELRATVEERAAALREVEAREQRKMWEQTFGKRSARSSGYKKRDVWDDL